MAEDITSEAINGECIRIHVTDSKGKKHIMTLDSRKMVDLIRLLGDNLGHFESETHETPNV
jgi:hypothetical protein